MSTMHAVISDRLYVCQGVDILPEGERYRKFVPEESIHYFSLCDDFGPMNLASVVSFVLQLDDELEAYPECIFFYCVDAGKRALTNAIFLLGSYMILRLHLNVKEVSNSFSWLNRKVLEPYRDATFSASDFDLTLEDCWGGLAKGIDKGWLALPSSSDEDYRWGLIDVDEYGHYDDPLNGDLHEVVPGKFIAFKGPVDLGDEGMYKDDERGFRSFSPRFYAGVLQDCGVTTVVRLCEPCYDKQRFVESGIAFHDLEFEDCTAPSAAIVDEFIRLADASEGVVAVHCKAGLGRTGTLIAVYLMRRHGFTGREAIGWLRIMRPGSVIGEQQHYLCGRPGTRQGADGRRKSTALAAEVAAGMERRGSLRARRAAAATAELRATAESRSESDVFARSKSV